MGVEKMKLYWKKQADSNPRWWFANTDVVKFNDWAVKNLGYARFKKAEGEQALLMKIQHDMGIVVIDRNGTMMNKEDVFSAGVQRDGMSKEQTSAYKQLVNAQLMASIRVTLNGEPITTEVKKSKTPIYLAFSAGLFFAIISGFFITKIMATKQTKHG